MYLHIFSERQPLWKRVSVYAIAEYISYLTKIFSNMIKTESINRV